MAGERRDRHSELPNYLNVGIMIARSEFHMQITAEHCSIGRGRNGFVSCKDGG